MPKPVAARAFAKLKIPVIFFAVSMIHLYPILTDFFTMLPYAFIGDVNLSLAILYSNISKLSLLQFGQLYHLPFLFPLSNTLTIGFTLFGQSLLLLPFFLGGEPNIYALYNGIVIFSYLAAGCGAYLFFRELQDNETVSLIAASLYILLPFRVYNIPHLNLMLNFPIPFSLYFLLKYLKKSRKKDLLLLNAMLLCQFLFDLSLGFYLSISLAFFVLIFVTIRRPVPLRPLLRLFLSLLPTIALVLLIHLPFLQKDGSLSPFSPSFNPEQYHPALSFYCNKSTLLLLLNRLWDPWPLFPGFSVVFFYIFAFSSYAKELRDRILLAAAVGAYAVPGLIAVVFFRKQAYAGINSLSEFCLLAFAGSLLALVFSLRKKIPLELKLVSYFLLAVVFISFEPFPRIFDVFNALAGIFPFLNRSRGLRTSYILPLAILGIFAFGLKAFIANRRGKKSWLWLIVLLLLLEHFRWPVSMARLPEPSLEAKKVYEMLTSYPSHYGILELPFVPTSSNMYPLFTRYHNKHTYHGHYLIYDDPLALDDEESLREENEFAGLKDPDLLNKLKANGLYLIMVNRSEQDPSAWRKTRNHIKNGRELGLYKEVKEERYSILIVLDDSQTGRDITCPIPYFALAGKTAVQFKVAAQQPGRCRIYFNGGLIAAKDYPAGVQRISLALPSLARQKQVNHIRVVNDQPMTVYDWLIE